MPKQLQINYQNAIYHVMNRGQCRQNIFSSDKHYQEFLSLLRDSVERCNFGWWRCLSGGATSLYPHEPYIPIKISEKRLHSIICQLFECKWEQISQPRVSYQKHLRVCIDTLLQGIRLEVSTNFESISRCSWNDGFRGCSTYSIRKICLGEKANQQVSNLKK